MHGLELQQVSLSKARQVMEIGIPIRGVASA